MNETPDNTSKREYFTFIDAPLSKVFERAAEFCKGREFDDPDISMSTNEEGEYILRIYGD